MRVIVTFVFGCLLCALWQYGLWSFKTGGIELESFCLRINILNENHWVLIIGLMGASEVFENQSFKSQLSLSSQKKIVPQIEILA